MKNIFNWIKTRLTETSTITGGVNIYMAMQLIPDPVTQAIFVLVGGLSILMPEKYKEIQKLIAITLSK